MLADNLRSAFNVGGVFRTVDACGGEMVHLCGYTARPPHPRLLRAAMGAQRLVAWRAWPDARQALDWCASRGFHLVGLEPTSSAEDYRHYPYRLPLCVVIGNEALGISPVVARRLHGVVRIPMHGYKGSLNVVVALGIVLFRVVEELGSCAEATPLTAGGSLDAVLARVQSRMRGSVWRLASPAVDGPALTLLLQTPNLPPCEIWACPETGGVALICRPAIAEAPPDAATAWEDLAEGTSRPQEPPPPWPPPGPRGFAFQVAVRLSRAASSGGWARLAFDHLVYELLRRPDLPVDAADSELTRFLDAQGSTQMYEAALRLTGALLHPMGGPWQPGELLCVTEHTGCHVALDAFARDLLGLRLRASSARGA